MTEFFIVYNSFFELITDDMYMEITEEQTKADCKGLLKQSVLLYEFPKHVLTFTESMNDLGEDTSSFKADLELEEINILAQGMLTIWLQRQINSIESMRQKTSGADFKISSQAAHLRQLQNQYDRSMERHWKLQALDSRRRVSRDGTKYESAFDLFIKPI